MRCLIGLLALVPLLASGQLEISQTGGTGWTCNGPEVTQHTTDNEAIESCGTQSLEAGGVEYLVTFDGTIRVSNTPLAGPAPEPDPVPEPEPDPTPDPGDSFADCQPYAEGYFCPSMREVDGYTEYDTYQNGTFAGWTYYPGCPPPYGGIEFQPACSEPDPDPTPDPPPPSSASCDNTYRGIPDPCAHLGYDVFADYPVDQVVTSGTSISGNGTASKPWVVDATGLSTSSLRVSGSYVIVNGGFVDYPDTDGPALSLSGCTNCTVRDQEIFGSDSNFNAGHDSACNPGSGNVILRMNLHGFGDRRVTASEQDYHGCKVMGRDVWILDSEIHDVSGDSIQCGDASRGDCQRVYIGGGHMHHNRENGIDIKDSRDVVVSGVLMEGFRPTSSSPGEAFIIHDDAYNAQIYDNVIRDTTLGIVSSGASGHIISGNDISAQTDALQLRNTQNITVQDNLLRAGVCNVQSGITGTLQSECR